MYCRDHYLIGKEVLNGWSRGTLLTSSETKAYSQSDKFEIYEGIEVFNEFALCAFGLLQ